MGLDVFIIEVILFVVYVASSLILVVVYIREYGDLLVLSLLGIIVFSGEMILSTMLLVSEWYYCCGVYTVGVDDGYLLLDLVLTL